MRVLALVGCQFFAACGDDGLPGKYNFLTSDEFRESLDVDLQRMREAIPYDSVSHGQGWCGSAVDYEVVVGIDGTARFHGGEESTMPGEWVGLIDRVSYARLFAFLDSRAALERAPRGPVVAADARCYTVRMWSRGQASSETYEGLEGSEAALDWWLFRSTIDGFVQYVRWERVE